MRAIRIVLLSAALGLSALGVLLPVRLAAYLRPRAHVETLDECADA